MRHNYPRVILTLSNAKGKAPYTVGTPRCCPEFFTRTLSPFAILSRGFC